jgi:hypothetical protein
MAATAIRMADLEPVREQIDDVTGQMSYAGQRMMRAGEMLRKGFTREQVCARLTLSPDVVDRLLLELSPELVDVEPIVPVKETWDEFRARKRQEMGKKIVNVVECHLDAQSDVAQLSGGLLDKDEMATVRDASVIAHKWLNEEKDVQQGPRVAISFSALAQVSPIDQAKPVFELPAASAPEAPPAGAESPGDDWLEG